MVSQDELERTIRYVLIRVECVERTDYNDNNHYQTTSNHQRKYTFEELNDELEALHHVRMNLNDFINRNQDLTVDQLCMLKDLKHRLYGAIQKLKEATCCSTNSNDPTTMTIIPKSPKKNTNKSNYRNQKNKHLNTQLSVNSGGGGGTSMTKDQSFNPLAFGGADCPTMIRFFVNQIHKNNPEIRVNPGSSSSSLDHQLESFSLNPSPFSPNSSPFSPNPSP
ncbi:uncharacterized protein LOC113790518 [Dermatophagoides pteronyssinus]|uniref:uncharacterized protein LOC113790518 n=1 Tax=Dermatophagoides pteronyssinus TaxID=6956 RepID=UPI003F677EBB